MKKSLQSILMLILFFSCTKLEKEQITEEKNKSSFSIGESSSSIVLDSITRTRLVYFVKHLYTTHQTIPDYKSKWDKISEYGDINFDSVAVFRSDSCDWYYLLPVENTNTLSGIVVLQIDEEEKPYDDKTKIGLRLTNKTSAPQLVTEKDGAYEHLRLYFQGGKKATRSKRNFIPKTKIPEGGKYFGYTYDLLWYTTVKDEEVWVHGGSPGRLEETLAYYKIMRGLNFNVISVGNGGFCLYFYYTSYCDTYESLELFAFEFGFALGRYLIEMGELIRVYPIFFPYGISEDYEDYGYSDFGNGGGYGGGSYPPTTPDKEESCNDAKCPDCKKCLNPTKPNCTKCSCACTHETCKGCGLPIREGNGVQTRSSATCNKTHTAYCSSTGVVCDCGERHLNDEGIPKCATIKQEVYEKYAAYRLMWELNIAEGGCENGGFLLSDETVVINFNPNNKLQECTLGMSYSCPINTKYRFVYKNKDGIQYPVGETTALKRTYIKGIVHPHPTPDSSQIISLDKKLGMLSNDLLISEVDIFTLKKYNVLGYILNQKKVYQFNAESRNEGGRYDNKSDSLKYFCPIVDTF